MNIKRKRIIGSIILFFLILSGVALTKENRNIDKDKIKEEVAQLTKDKIISYLNLYIAGKRTPRETIYAIKLMEKRWEDELRSISRIYVYLAYSYTDIDEYQKAYQSYCKLYTVMHPMNPEDTKAVRRQQIEKELFAIKKLREDSVLEEKLAPFVFKKVKEFLNKYKDLTPEQKKRAEYTVNIYEKLYREQAELEKELKRVREKATKYLNKLCELISGKDKGELKNFLLSTMEDKNLAEIYTEILLREFNKYRKVYITPLQIVKHPTGLYMMSYTWNTIPKYRKEKSKDSVGNPIAEFKVTNNNLILISL